ncbi:MAG: AAA domain-containing protein [Planctomycetes bacterium]|nr:AAA domain-containing protein [Planctomycetota bacterium]
MLKQAHDGCQRLTAEIGKVIVGQDAIVRQLLSAVFCEGHVLIIGVPGLAKTLLVKTLAEALGWTFKRIQFTPDLMPADIIGMELLQEDPTGGRHWQFMHGPVFANLVLADEINRTPPKTQSALLEAMQEYNVTSMGKSYPLARPFIVVATQNPIEQEGTYPLPEAQLDRFMLSLWIDYPSRTEEEDIVAQTTSPRDVSIERVFTQEQMMALQQLVRRMPVGKHVVKYAVAIARATRPDDAEAGDYVKRYVEWGAGPRAGQNLVLAGKALAALDGRPAVTSEHIRQAAESVLRHRVLPNYNAAGEGIRSQQIIRHVLTEVREPAYA